VNADRKRAVKSRFITQQAEQDPGQALKTRNVEKHSNFDAVSEHIPKFGKSTLYTEAPVDSLTSNPDMKV